MKKTLLSLVAALLAMCLFAGCLPPKTKEYTWPVELINLSGKSPAKTKESLENGSPKMIEKVIINEDGSVTLFCTEEQRLLWLENIESLFENKIPEYKEDYNVQISLSEDRTSVEITADPYGSDSLGLVVAMKFSIGECYLYQLFSNTPQEECFVEYSFVNVTTGKTVASATFPGEGVTLNPETWW